MLMAISRSAQLTLQVVGEQGVGLAGRAITSIETQRIRFGGGDTTYRARALCPLEQPEADPERETICQRETPQLIGCGDVEDLLVLGIRRVGDAAVQRGVHDDSFEMNGGDGCGERGRRAFV